MASHMDAPEDLTEDSDGRNDGARDRIDDHLRSALESTDDDAARYHLREALQLKIADMQGP